MLPLRAVEHRVAIARAANTGVSAFVEPAGRIGPHAAALRARASSITASRCEARTTLYTRLGDWLVYACARRRARGCSAFALFRRSLRDMLGELKRDVAELDKRLDDLRGHL